MKIAFDLDGTLIGCGSGSLITQKWPLLKWCGMEALREGTVELMRYFQQQGDEIWIYTTSYRSISYIRLLFLLHGILLKGIINQAIHDRKIKGQATFPQCSKYPPAFAIDILIDDQPGVKIEAERYGFQMIWIRPDEEAWTEKIKVAYEKIKADTNRVLPDLTAATA